MAGQPEENVLAYDTVFEMIVKDIESIQTMQKDEEFLRTTIPDHFNFADMTRSKYVVTFWSLLLILLGFANFVVI